MKTKQIKTFSFEELTESAKDRALNQFRYVNVEYFDWYHSVYDDAQNIGIQITGFDLDRGSYCTGKFLSSHWSIDVANKIIEEHGEDCETYKIAEKFLQDYYNLTEDDEVTEIDDEFLKNILEEYLTMLKNEFEYHTSDDAISEWIINNDIVFDESGEEIKHELI
jgi:hypothetical protein